MEGVADLEHARRPVGLAQRDLLRPDRAGPKRAQPRTPIQNSSTKVSATCANIGIRIASIDMAPSDIPKAWPSATDRRRLVYSALRRV